MKQLNNKEIKQLNENLKRFELIISNKSRIIEDNDALFVDGNVSFLRHNNNWLPLLKSECIDKLKSIYIDKGAIPFVVKGADLMKPGVISTDEFKKDEVVVIRDAEHKKALALGIALFDSEELIKQEKGKVIKTYSYVGDKYW